MDKEKIFNNIRLKKSFKYTIKYNLFTPNNYFFFEKKSLINNVFKKNIKLKFDKNFSINKNKKYSYYLKNIEMSYDLRPLKLLFLETNNKNKNLIKKNNHI